MVVLEWRFYPPDCFEEQINLERNDYKLVIGSGKAEARIRAELYEKKPTMMEDLNHALNNRFLGVQLLTHKPYELSNPLLYRIYPDGRKDYFIFAEPGVFSISGGTFDFAHIDKNGNVIRDTKAERIRKKQRLADLAEKYGSSDVTAQSLLKSYNMAITDPNNELVHLYEILDALAEKFGGKDAACKALNLSLRKWRRLGNLANKEPLKQGRHRGKSLGLIRDAMETELAEARNIALCFIEAYLEYLERQDREV
jgi:hypothetical protein